MFGGGMEDMLNAMFSGGMGGPVFAGSRGMRGQRSARSRDAVHALPVTLEDLYNGKRVQVTRLRTIICPDCKGSGAKKKKSVRRNNTCTECRGNGSRMILQQMGMMIQQMQVVCDACQGSGETMDPRNLCSRCSGSKTAVVEASVDVVVEKGMKHLQRIILPRMADEDPGVDTPGDLTVVLQEAKHEFFTRDGADLHMEHHISLAEALCGFQFKFTHLDGRELVVRQPRGVITKPGDVRCVTHEGMPVYKQDRKFGRLIIEFTIDYPERLEGEQVMLLRQALPPPKSVDVAPKQDAGEVCYVTREDLSILEEELRRDAEDEDENQGRQQGCTVQ